MSLILFVAEFNIKADGEWISGASRAVISMNKKLHAHPCANLSKPIRSLERQHTASLLDKRMGSHLSAAVSR